MVEAKVGVSIRLQGRYNNNELHLFGSSELYKILTSTCLDSIGVEAEGDNSIRLHGRYGHNELQFFDSSEFYMILTSARLDSDGEEAGD